MRWHVYLLTSSLVCRKLAEGPAGGERKGPRANLQGGSVLIENEKDGSLGEIPRDTCPLPPQHLFPRGFRVSGESRAEKALLLPYRLCGSRTGYQSGTGTSLSPRELRTHKQDPNLTVVFHYSLPSEKWNSRKLGRYCLFSTGCHFQLEDNIYFSSKLVPKWFR